MGTFGAMFGVFLAQKVRKTFALVRDEAVADYYVSDVVDALISISKNNNISGEYFNVGSGSTVTVNKVIKLLKDKYSKFQRQETR